MRFYKEQHHYYCGIDLHTKVMYICIMDQSGKILYHKNIQTDPNDFLEAINPYKEDIVVCVECIFTWYWISDVCVEHNIPFVLGHALYMKAISGGKTKNDRIDSEKIAALLRGGLIPQAYVYPARMRATRDLLRRRQYLVRRKSDFLSHIQNTNHQYNMPLISKKITYGANRKDLAEHFEIPLVQISVQTDVEIVNVLAKQITYLESIVLKGARYHDPVAFTLLKTIPGIGKILGLTILYEIHDIKRFPKVQNFVSYCRLIKCPRESSGKSMGSKNSKIGNAHLKWAFSEAAVLFIKDNDFSKKYHRNLVNHYGRAKAMSIIAHKLARAAYYILKRRECFDYNIFYSAIRLGIDDKPTV
jgi:transposase